MSGEEIPEMNSKIDKHVLAIEKLKRQILHSGELANFDYIQQLIVLDLLDTIVISYLKEIYSDKYDQ